MSDLQQIRDELLFIADGCLVPPDGGSPDIYDAMASAKRALIALDRMIETRAPQDAPMLTGDIKVGVTTFRQGVKLSTVQACIDSHINSMPKTAPQGCVDDQPKCTWDFYRSTLERFVHETTHLSPQNDDGSHDCKISKKCLLHGRIALELLGKLSAAPTPAPTEKVDYKQLKQLVFMWAADVNGAPLDSDICEIINIIRRTEKVDVDTKIGKE